MAEECGEGTKGANVSFSGIYGTSRDLHDTDGQWETLTLYGRTGKGQKEVTVMVRLGGYGSENTGKAWFTDVRLEQVETVPVGETVLDLATPAPSKKTDTSEPQTARDMSIPAAHRRGSRLSGAGGGAGSRPDESKAECARGFAGCAAGRAGDSRIAGVHG